LKIKETTLRRVKPEYILRLAKYLKLDIEGKTPEEILEKVATFINWKW